MGSMIAEENTLYYGDNLEVLCQRPLAQHGAWLTCPALGKGTS